MSDAAKNLAAARSMLSDAIYHRGACREELMLYENAIIAAAVERAREPKPVSFTFVQAERCMWCGDKNPCATHPVTYQEKSEAAQPAAPSKAREWFDKTLELFSACLPNEPVPASYGAALLTKIHQAVALIEAAERAAQDDGSGVEIVLLRNQRDAAIRERDEARETVSVQQQTIDSVIVACGSLGLMASELPAYVASLRAQLRDAEAAKHEHAAAVLGAVNGVCNVRHMERALYDSLIREQEAARAARGQK